MITTPISSVAAGVGPFLGTQLRPLLARITALMARHVVPAMISMATFRILGGLWDRAAAWTSRRARASPAALGAPALGSRYITY